MKTLTGLKSKVLFPLLIAGTLTACNQQEFYEKEYLEGVGVEKDIDVDIPTQNEPEDIAVPEKPTVETPPQATPTTPVVQTPEVEEPVVQVPEVEEPVVQVPEVEEPVVQVPEVEEPVVEVPEVASPTPQIISTTDNFTGKADIQKAKVDILWVIDDSGSMKDEQEAIAHNFDTFIKSFIEQDIDFQMGITTTDARSGYKGRQIGDLSKLNSAYAAADKWQFINYFASTIQVGTRGSGKEMGLATASEYLNRHSNFLREDAYLAIVYVSDEEDQSQNSVNFYKEDLLKHKKNNGLVKTYSIVNTNLNGLSWSGYLGQRYMDISDSTNGVVSDIRGDFHSTLKNFGDEIVILLDAFALSKNAKKETVTVKVDGIEVNGWSYDSFNNTVKFEESSAPQAGAEIKITYQQRD